MKHSHEASPETSSPVLSHFTLSSSSFLSKESARRVCAQVSQDLFSKRYPGTTVWTRSHSCHLTAPYNDCDKKPLFPSLVPHPVGQEPEASQRRAALEMKTPGKLTHHLGQWHLLCFRHNQHIRRAVSGRCQNWGGISPKEECPLTRQYCISLHSSSKLPFSAQIHELAGEFDHLSLGILISFHQSSNALFSDFNLKKHSNVHPCVNSSGTELPDIMRHMVKPVGWGQRRRLRCPPEALGRLGGRGQWTSPCEETGGALTVTAESLCVWGQDVLHSTCASSLCPFPLLSVPSSLISFSVPLCHPGTTCPLAPIFPPFTYKILSLLRFSFLTSPPSSPHISQSLQTNGNSPQSEARRKHPSPKIQGTEPAWRTGIMSDISQGREKRPQMITKMLLAAMTTTAIQPQYQGCGGNKINCMFISPAQPGCLSRRKPRRRCLQSSAHHLPENQDTWWQLAYLSPNSHLLWHHCQLSLTRHLYRLAFRVPCAQVRRLNSRPASVAPILGHMASMDGWLPDPEGSVQTRLCLWSGRWEVEPHLTKQEAAFLLRVKPKPNNEKQSNQ